MSQDARNHPEKYPLSTDARAFSHKQEAQIERMSLLDEDEIDEASLDSHELEAFRSLSFSTESSYVIPSDGTYSDHPFAELLFIIFGTAFFGIIFCALLILGITLLLRIFRVV